MHYRGSCGFRGMGIGGRKFRGVPAWGMAAATLRPAIVAEMLALLNKTR